MEISTEMIQLLSQVGYLACFNGDIEKGQLIMDSVEENCQGQSAALIGVSISRIYAGQYEDAIRILKEGVLVTEPENMTAKCFLGMALSESGGSDEAIAVFEEVIQKGGEDDKTIASFYLAEMSGNSTDQQPIEQAQPEGSDKAA
ncbi:MAG: tetratricopeptide repeat protein [Thiotrichaceae bacterium]|nr:tetratricopeptide repeat protein [Thiotrichaceae bacterium]